MFDNHMPFHTISKLSCHIAQGALKHVLTSEVVISRMNRLADVTESCLLLPPDGAAGAAASSISG